MLKVSRANALNTIIALAFGGIVLILAINFFHFEILFCHEIPSVIESITRTFVFALTTAFVCVVGGLTLAVALSSISFYSFYGRLLSMLIIPMTLGNITIAYIFKKVFADSLIFEIIILHGSCSQLIAISFLQFWQYGFLFTYVFWISIINIPSRFNDYSFIIKNTRFEWLRDVVLPNVKNLFILLFVIGFVFSFYEGVKNIFIFKSSQGTGTELITQALNRIYQSFLPIDTNLANDSIINSGFFIVCGLLLVLTILCYIIISVLNLFYKFNVSFGRPVLRGHLPLSSMLPVICFVIIFVPVVAALCKSSYITVFNMDLLHTLILTIFAAFIATACAAAAAMCSKLIFYKWLDEFNMVSLTYFLFIFFIQLIPSIIIVILSFKLLSIIGYNASTIHLVWIIGHCILSFPLLCGFLLVTFFSVSQNEIVYLKYHNISVLERIKVSFIKRYSAEYILTILFAFVIIWNDASLNMILSDQIPSFAKHMEMSFVGRAANASHASSYVLVSVIISIACLALWQYITHKHITLNIK